MFIHYQVNSYQCTKYPQMHDAPELFTKTYVSEAHLREDNVNEATMPVKTICAYQSLVKLKTQIRIFDDLKITVNLEHLDCFQKASMSVQTVSCKKALHNVII